MWQVIFFSFDCDLYYLEQYSGCITGLISFINFQWLFIFSISIPEKKVMPFWIFRHFPFCRGLSRWGGIHVESSMCVVWCDNDMVLTRQLILPPPHWGTKVLGCHTEMDWKLTRVRYGPIGPSDAPHKFPYHTSYKVLASSHQPTRISIEGHDLDFQGSGGPICAHRGTDPLGCQHWIGLGIS